MCLVYAPTSATAPGCLLESSGVKWRIRAHTPRFIPYPLFGTLHVIGVRNIRHSRLLPMFLFDPHSNVGNPLSSNSFLGLRERQILSSKPRLSVGCVRWPRSAGSLRLNDVACFLSLFSVSGWECYIISWGAGNAMNDVYLRAVVAGMSWAAQEFHETVSSTFPPQFC